MSEWSAFDFKLVTLVGVFFTIFVVGLPFGFELYALLFDVFCGSVPCIIGEFDVEVSNIGAALADASIETGIFGIDFGWDDLARPRVEFFHILVGSDIAGEVFVGNALQDVCLDDGGEDGAKGYADDHAWETEETAADEDGDKDHETGDTDGIAENFGSKQVAVKLLEQENKSHKPYGRNGISTEEEEAAGNGSDERSEEGNDVGHAYDDGDEFDVLDIDKKGINEKQTKVAQDTDDGRIDDFADEETAEFFVDKATVFEDLVGGCDIAECVADASSTSHDGILGDHDIDGNDESQHDIFKESEDIYDTVGDFSGNTIEHCGELTREPFFQGCNG